MPGAWEIQQNICLLGPTLKISLCRKVIYEKLNRNVNHFKRRPRPDKAVLYKTDEKYA